MFFSPVYTVHGRFSAVPVPSESEIPMGHGRLSTVRDPSAYRESHGRPHARDGWQPYNLATCHSKRHVWSRRASLLIRRQEDLTRLQKFTLSSMPSSRYSSFSVQLFKSKMGCLLEGEWAGKDAENIEHLGRVF